MFSSQIVDTTFIRDELPNNLAYMGNKSLSDGMDSKKKSIFDFLAVERSTNFLYRHFSF